MPGIRFTRGDPPAELVPPSADARRVRRPRRGTGLVFLHHSIASWPAWPGFAELVGGRFHYQPATLAGTDYPDSGYRFDVRHTVEILDPDHPVCAGLGERFEITDELYCFPVLEDTVTPLMRTTFDTSDRQFSSADLAIRGRRDIERRLAPPAGSDLVGLDEAGRRLAPRLPPVRRRAGDVRRPGLPPGAVQRHPLDRAVTTG